MNEAPALRSAEVRPYRLPFQRVVNTGRGVFKERVGWLVGLEDAEGRFGWGDAAPWPGFGPDAVAACRTLEAAEGRHQDAAGLFAHLAVSVEAQGAWAFALSDLAAQVHDLSLAGMLGALNGTTPTSTVRVHALVNTAGEAAAAVSAGYQTLKVKIGLASLDAECLRVAEIRAVAGDSVTLRLDANGVFELAQALAFVRRCVDGGPVLFEQPCRSLDDVARLRAATGARMALDESLTGPNDVRRALSLSAMDVAVLKPAFLGGPFETMALARMCLAAGVGVIVTCALESAIGRRGALHVAAALRDAEPAGLEAPLAADVAGFPAAMGGVLSPEWRPGLGASPVGRVSPS